MSLFFQPKKRFSNEVRVKDRDGSAHRRLLKKRKRQKPLPGTKKLRISEDAGELGDLRALRRKRLDFDSPDNKAYDRMVMVLAGSILLVLGASVLFRIPIVFHAFLVLALIALHILVIGGQCAVRGANQKLLVYLFVVYGGLILWLVLLPLKGLLF